MKNLVILISMLLIPFLGYSQEQFFKVKVRPWAKGKSDLPWKEFDTRTLAQLKGFSVVRNFKTNEYGSDTKAPRYKSTGFFRAERINNRWWMIDPDGYRNLQQGITALRQGTSERNKSALAEKYGTGEKWIAETATWLHSIGFFASGAWSDDETIASHNANRKNILTRSIMLNLMSGYGKERGGTYQLPGNTGYPNQCIFVFDEGFKAYCEKVCQKLAQNKSDKNIVGYFSDNELPFGLKNLEGYLSLQNPNDPGRLFAEEWMKNQGLTLQQITDSDRANFAGIVAEHYYKTVSEAIKKYDSNHLYLGSRLHGSPKSIRQIVEAAGRHCDIVSINYYGDWTPNAEKMKNWGVWAGKPFIITEFYTKGMDSGLGNTTGAGFAVETQQDRGYAYQNFVIGLIESANCVGWHWFRYQDNDPQAKGADPSNLDSNKGIVDNNYNPYMPLVKAMRELNINAYRLADWFDKSVNQTRVK